MRILFLKYLAFLLLGIVIGVYALGEYTQRQTSPIEEFASVQAQASEEPPVIPARRHHRYRQTCHS